VSNLTAQMLLLRRPKEEIRTNRSNLGSGNFTRCEHRERERDKERERGRERERARERARESESVRAQERARARERKEERERGVGVEERERNKGGRGLFVRERERKKEREGHEWKTEEEGKEGWVGGVVCVVCKREEIFSSCVCARACACVCRHLQRYIHMLPWIEFPQSI